MRIPHTINQNTVSVYATSPQTLQLLDERNISLRAGNLLWEASECESLHDMCINIIASNFEKYPIFHELTQADRDHILELISTELPLTMVIPLIKEDYYWKRRFNAKYGEVIENNHPGSTWKCIFLERYIREIIENCQPSSQDEYMHDEIIGLCVPFVHCLYVKQLMYWSPPLTLLPEEIPEKYPCTHISLQPFLSKLVNVTFLDIQIGMKGVGLDYDKHMFEVDPNDMDRLARALNEAKNITFLKIHKTDIRCAHIKKFVKVLVFNKLLNEIEITYCQIGNLGAKCLASLILRLPQLRSLNLRCNNIESEGAKGLAYALIDKRACKLTRLDLSLNPLGPEGIFPVCSSLLRCDIPTELIINGVQLTGPTCIAVASVLKYNRSLKELAIANNDFDDEAGRVFLKALEDNKVLMKMDMRGTLISDFMQEQIQDKLKENYDAHMKDRRMSIRPVGSHNTLTSPMSDIEYDEMTYYSNVSFA